jgi:hypothetical protein
MKKNESTTDRIIRAVIGLVLLAVAYYDLSGVLSIIAYIVGAAAIVTATIGYCGLYTLLGISTIKK